MGYGTEARCHDVARAPRARRHLDYRTPLGMVRLRPLAAAVAAFALLAGALVFAPIGSTQRGIPTLSPTPPVPLPPATKPKPTPTPPTTPTTTPAPTPTPARPVLPKTGVDVALMALVGLTLLASGATLRRTVAVTSPRRRR